jgi:hypothetical protein
MIQHEIPYNPWTWIFEIVTFCTRLSGILRGSLLSLWTILIKSQLKVNVNSSKKLIMDKYSSIELSSFSHNQEQDNPNRPF